MLGLQNRGGSHWRIAWHWAGVALELAAIGYDLVINTPAMSPLRSRPPRIARRAQKQIVKLFAPNLPGGRLGRGRPRKAHQFAKVSMPAGLLVTMRRARTNIRADILEAN